MAKTGCLRSYFSPNPKRSSTTVTFCQLGKAGRSYSSGHRVELSSLPPELGHSVYTIGASSSFVMPAQRMWTTGDGTDALIWYSPRPCVRSADAKNRRIQWTDIEVMRLHNAVYRVSSGCKNARVGHSHRDVVDHPTKTGGELGHILSINPTSSNGGIIVEKPDRIRPPGHIPFGNSFTPRRKILLVVMISETREPSCHPEIPVSERTLGRRA